MRENRYVLVAVCILFLFALVPATLFAQPTATEPTTPLQWYSTVAGVVAATLLGVSILKRALGNVSGINQVPTWMFAVAVSALLTFLTNRVWKTLPGELWQLMMQSVFMAAAASGFYEWLNGPTKTLQHSLIKAQAKIDS